MGKLQTIDSKKQERLWLKMLLDNGVFQISSTPPQSAASAKSSENNENYTSDKILHPLAEPPVEEQQLEETKQDMKDLTTLKRTCTLKEESKQTECNESKRSLTKRISQASNDRKVSKTPRLVRTASMASKSIRSPQKPVLKATHTAPITKKEYKRVSSRRISRKALR